MFNDRRVNLTKADAALLHEVEEALATGQATGGRWDLWVAIARSIPLADDGFRSALRERLTASHRVSQEREAPRGLAAVLTRLQPARRSPRLLVAAVVFLALVLPLGVAVAQGHLANVIPVRIREPIEGLITRTVPITRVGSNAELQALAPFPIWLPAEMPCPGASDRTYHPTLRTARILYDCLAVTERSAADAYHPLVDQGSQEDVVIDGLPGYYFEQTVVSPNSGFAQTTPSLVFERGGTTITLSALPWHARGRDGTLLSKADLIRIATSMMPVRSP